MTQSIQGKLIYNFFPLTDVTSDYNIPPMIQKEHAPRIVDSKLRPIAVNPHEVLDQEFIYVDAITDHVLLQVGEKKARLTKLGAKELALRLIEQI